MVIIIHYINGKIIELRDREINQEYVNNFYELISKGEGMIHYIETSGKNHIIPLGKILHIETKLKL